MFLCLLFFQVAGGASVDLKLDAIAGHEDLVWLSSDYVAKNAAIAGEATEVFEIIIELVDLDVLETRDGVYVPIGVADVVLTQCVLYQVHLVLDFHRVHLWDDHHFAQLAEQVLVVW